MLNDTEFRRGYYLAVAELVRRHDEPTIAADLLVQYGPVDLSGIDREDAREIHNLTKSEHISIPDAR